MAKAALRLQQHILVLIWELDEAFGVAQDGVGIERCRIEHVLPEMLGCECVITGARVQREVHSIVSMAPLRLNLSRHDGRNGGGRQGLLADRGQIVCVLLPSWEAKSALSQAWILLLVSYVQGTRCIMRRWSQALLSSRNVE